MQCNSMIGRLSGLALTLAFTFTLAGGGAFARGDAASGAGAQPALSFSGNFLAAIVAGASKDTDSEAVYLREALQLAPGDADLLRRAFVASLASGDMEEAFALAERALKGGAVNPLAEFVLAVRDMKARNWARARFEFAKTTSGPLELPSVVLTAWSFAGAGDADRALEVLDQIKNERFARFRDHHAALIAQLRGYTYEARKRWRALYSAEPNNLRTSDGWARFLAQSGDFEQARQVYEAIDKLAPRQPMLAALGADLEAGRIPAPQVGDPMAGAAETLYGIGSALAGQSGHELSLSFLRLALYLDPGHALAWATLGDIQAQLKQFQSAIAAYRAVPERSPMRVTAEIQIGAMLQALDRPKEAVAHMQEVVSRYPQDVAAVGRLGDLYRVQKNWEAAAETYTRGLKLIGEPRATDWGWFFSRGIAYERMKKWALAEKDLRKALALNPDHPQVLNYLAYSWADRGVNLDEALEMLTKAADRAKEDGQIIDSLGWVYYQLGRYEDAERELERALKMVPGEAVINEHLGDVYWKLGRHRDAVFKWNHARDLNPAPEDLARIMEKLSRHAPEVGG